MNLQIFKEIQTLKRQIMPNEKLILFGSQARGDAKPDSDWDLLILLNSERSTFKEDYDTYASPFDEVGLKYNTLVNAVIYNIKEWDERPSLLKYNVEREGIEII
ncbi:MAG: nucleotidyltransferase domain-containing protein [Tannerella sp.]|jgi:predicted nucleotidyltransferase|nr:nucleotidyltransferase domain-containing protein [Tannerella sp.]